MSGPRRRRKWPGQFREQIEARRFVRHAAKVWNLTRAQAHHVLGGSEMGRAERFTHRCFTVTGRQVVPPMYIERAELLLSGDPPGWLLERVADSRDLFPDRRTDGPAGEPIEDGARWCKASHAKLSRRSGRDVGRLLDGVDLAMDFDCPGCGRRIRPLAMWSDFVLVPPHHRVGDVYERAEERLPTVAAWLFFVCNHQIRHDKGGLPADYWNKRLREAGGELFDAHPGSARRRLENYLTRCDQEGRKPDPRRAAEILSSPTTVDPPPAPREYEPSDRELDRIEAAPEPEVKAGACGACASDPCACEPQCVGCGASMEDADRLLCEACE